MSATAKVRCCYVCGNPIIGACLITDKGDAHSSCVHLSDRNGEIARQAAIISQLQAEIARYREAFKCAMEADDDNNFIAALTALNNIQGTERNAPRCPKCGAQADERFDCCKG